MGSTVLATPEKQKPAAEDKMTADSPFKAYGGAMDDDAHYSDQEPVREDISDGLQIFSAYKWVCAGLGCWPSLPMAPAVIGGKRLHHHSNGDAHVCFVAMRPGKRSAAHPLSQTSTQ